MSALRIGPYTLPNSLILAPMAGVTDQPFRQLCKRMGAGLVVSEMVTSDVRLWNTRKSSLRMMHTGDLYRAWLGITLVDHAHPRLAGVPQAHVTGDHFRDHKPCAQTLAKLTKGLVGDPRHRGENQAVL